jgi:hypothetical protein
MTAGFGCARFGAENRAGRAPNATVGDDGMFIARSPAVNEKRMCTLIRLSLLLSLPASGMLSGCWHERRHPDVYYVERRRVDPDEHREHERREEKREERREERHEHDPR